MYFNLRLLIRVLRAGKKHKFLSIVVGGTSEEKIAQSDQIVAIQIYSLSKKEWVKSEPQNWKCKFYICESSEAISSIMTKAKTGKYINLQIKICPPFDVENILSIGYSLSMSISYFLSKLKDKHF
jgi:uncharacterized membrane protein